MAKKRWRVIFLEEPVQGEGPARLESRTVAPNIEVLTPHTPVPFAGFHDEQLAHVEPLLAAFLEARRCRPDLLWLYTPMALPLASAFARAPIVYDRMDDLASFHGAPRQLRQREHALLGQASLVLAGGPSLHRAVSVRHPRAHCIPSAVEPTDFDPRRLDAASEAARTAHTLQGALAGPRLGFFGVIDERLDAPLLGALAARHPQWQFVMVGPVVKIDPQSLPRHPNLHWLGMQPYPVLAHLLAGWDVCLMPFALNEATRSISPTKTLEYLAGDKPVVSTPVPDVVELYGHAVRIAPDAEGFAAAIAEALAEGPLARHARIEAARATVAANSWDGHAATIEALLAPLRTPAPEVQRKADPMPLAVPDAA
jgi:glycosyltransferase involved in cell wall biosynthesis